jgi:hypothetical protein
MHSFSLRRRGAAVLLLAMLVSSSLTAATSALAAGPASLASQGLTYYATYSSYESCAAAGIANARGRSWECLESSRGFGLYFS